MRTKIHTFSFFLSKRTFYFGADSKKVHNKKKVIIIEILRQDK